MITSVDEAKKIAGEFNSLQTDQEKINYIRSHKNKLKIVVGVFSHHVDFICDDHMFLNIADIELTWFVNKGVNFINMLLENTGINAEDE